jgi:DNA-binding transcriptional regulator YdaS (Cro superfamily)
MLVPLNTSGVTMEQTQSGISAAVSKAGNQVALASKLGVTQQAVSCWLRRGWVPLGRAAEIEHVTGISRETLVNPRVAELVGAERR